MFNTTGQRCGICGSAILNGLGHACGGTVTFPHTVAAPSVPLQLTVWNGPICHACGQGYLGDLMLIPCPDGRKDCRVTHYGHVPLAPVSPAAIVTILRYPDVQDRGAVKDAVANAVREALGTDEPIGVDILPNERERVSGLG